MVEVNPPIKYEVAKFGQFIAQVLYHVCVGMLTLGKHNGKNKKFKVILAFYFPMLE